MLFPEFSGVVPLVRKLSNLILYSSLWISICAAALVLFTFDVTGSRHYPYALTGFVFCGTLALYAIHRITGIERVRKYAKQGRFEVISQYKSHILLYGSLGALGALFFVFQLSWQTIQWLVMPCLISLLYVVPISRNKRLRDISVIKIFLVASMWAVLTGVIPFAHTGKADWWSGTILFAERLTFVFAITIPFDIRDVEADRASGVKTLPHLLGLKKSKLLAIAILGVSACLTFLLIRSDVYQDNLSVPYVLTGLITAFLIWNSQPGLDDHYYSGLLDGTMFLLPLMYWIWTSVLR